MASGEANGLPIVFREDGYINATRAAKEFDRDIREFLKLGSTQDYMEALEKMTGIPVNIQKQSTRGRNGATFLHPKLDVRPAQWLDVHAVVAPFKSRILEREEDTRYRYRVSDITI